MAASLAVLIALLALFAAPEAAPAGASFEGLGDLPGGSFRSEGRAVSDDGEVVVGASQIGPNRLEAFRWTAEIGMEGLGRLGDFPGAFLPSSYARGISGDGAVVVGESSIDTGSVAFRWTRDGGMESIHNLPFTLFQFSRAIAASQDGGVIVGGADQPINGPFRWTRETGMEELVPSRTPNTFANGYGVSADGSVIVGRFQREAFIWTEVDSMRLLREDAPDEFEPTWAWDVSGDGRIVVGQGEYRGGIQGSAQGSIRGYVWSEAQGLRLLDDPGRGERSAALAVSDDGAIVVGTFRRQAVVWDPLNGMRELATVLSELGVDTGWPRLSSAEDVTPDGRVIVGSGISVNGSEAFRAILFEDTIEIIVDIRPGDGANPVSLKSRGVLPVAILGTERFDVTVVDVTTLSFGPGGAVPKHTVGGHLEDVDGDGRLDLLSHFRIPALGIGEQDREACLSGETLDGTGFGGCDALLPLPR